MEVDLVSFALTFAGVVSRGIFLPDNMERYALWLKAHEGKRVQVGVRGDRPTRSNQGNRYLWGVCYAIVAGDTGNDPESVHLALKREALRLGILPPVYLHLGDRVIETEPTTVVPADVFSTYVDWVRSYSATELGIAIPTAQEVEPNE